MKRLMRSCSAIAIAIVLASCQTFGEGVDGGYGIIDYGDRNAATFKAKVQRLLNDKTGVVTITQLGDSHTAADFFTGSFRELIQKRLGNAGIGWITPTAIKGQRHAIAKWQTQQWDVISSRTEMNPDFGLGGYIAKPKRNGAMIQVSSYKTDEHHDLWDVRMMVKSNAVTPMTLKNREGQVHLIDQAQVALNNQWRAMNAITTLPFSIIADEQMSLGGLWLQKHDQSGVIVSAIGTNGAQLSIWEKWSSAWLAELKMSQSDLVILEYGTNESFNENLDEKIYRKTLVSSIRTVRKQLPHAVILLISPPDTMMKGQKTGSCVERMPPAYAKVKSVQLAVAKSEKVLFWDWQKAMGGRCNIAKWHSEGLASADLVHLTPLGYEISAEMFYKSLMKYLGVPKK